MNWQDICENPTLQNLPFKIETNEYGQLIMSPATNWHGIIQSLIEDELKKRIPDGIVYPEGAINTRKGTRVPDVVWVSGNFLRQHGAPAEFPVAPELCVEVISKFNTDEEMQDKRELYFERNAKEVWLCDLNGQVRFFSASGERAQSELFPDFPNKIAVDFFSA